MPWPKAFRLPIKTDVQRSEQQHKLIAGGRSVRFEGVPYLTVVLTILLSTEERAPPICHAREANQPVLCTGAANLRRTAHNHTMRLLYTTIME